MNHPIALGITGLFAALFGLRALSHASNGVGARAAAIGQIAIGGAAILTAGIAAFDPTAVDSTLWPWVWGAVGVTYGSIIVRIVQIGWAARARRLSEGERLSRYLQHGDRPDRDAV